MVLDTSIHNTQRYKVCRIEWSNLGNGVALSLLYFGVVAVEKGAFGLPSTTIANGVGHQGSIPGWVIPKTQKIVLGAAFLNTQHYKVWIKGNPGNGVASSPTSRCSSFWKGILQVTLDERLIYIYIYIYIYIKTFFLLFLFFFFFFF